MRADTGMFVIQVNFDQAMAITPAPHPKIVKKRAKTFTRHQVCHLSFQLETVELNFRQVLS